MDGVEAAEIATDGPRLEDLETRLSNSFRHHGCPKLVKGPPSTEILVWTLKLTGETIRV